MIQLVTKEQLNNLHIFNDKDQYLTVENNTYIVIKSTEKTTIRKSFKDLQKAIIFLNEKIYKVEGTA